MFAPDSGKGLDIAILTISDALLPEDQQRPTALANRIVQAGHKFAGLITLPDDSDSIRRQIQDWIDADEVDVILALDETAWGRASAPPAVSFVMGGLERSDFAELVSDDRLGVIGVINIRSAIAWAKHSEIQ